MIHRLTEIDWQFPWGLWIALTPLVISGLAWLRRRRMLDYAEAELRPWAMRGSAAPRAGEVWSEWLLWLLLALAMAGPRIPAAENAVKGEQHLRRDVNVMLVLDVGSSMQRALGSSSALARSKLELADLLTRLQGERVGLIIFAASAGLVLPPTYDYDIVLRFLDLADQALVDPGPSDYGAALALAQRGLLAHSATGNAILLISDIVPGALRGEAGARALRTAQGFAANKIQFAILQVAEAAVPNDEVRELAAIGGGVTARIEDGDGDWRKLYDEKIRRIASAYKPPRNAELWVELYPWLLVPAALIVIFSHWTLSLHTLALTLLALLSGSARADLPELNAYQAFRQHDFARAQLYFAAQRGYAARLGEGASAYRRKDYEYAAAQFALALLESRNATQRADALFNIGNARYMQGRFDAAVEAYRDADRFRKNDVRIYYNQQLALAQLGSQRRARGDGVPGRRGTRLGEGMDDDITNRPVGMEDEKTEPWMTLDESAAAQSASRGQLGGGTARSTHSRHAISFKDEASVAAKKAEMLRDEPKVLLSTLLRFEQQRQRNAGAE